MEKNLKPFGKSPRKVSKIDVTTNEVIETYDSVSDASKTFDDKYARVKITYCCQGKQRLALGFKWKYIE